ncbi:MAG TPA: response regulator [Frateuria sp.]|uniref:response regulator transcription factor n=1 Tax=Frateuria sp. TaxID=2211372 RepID=UPI002DF65E7C|nr:response regulator [Frateuria sp.]
MLRILLVEDEPDISAVASIALEEAGYHVTVASDGAWGLELALQETPELIVTDFMMPGLDGLTMIERIRSCGYRNPIVLTTAIPECQLPKRPGYNAFLPKPYRLSSLVEVIESLRVADGRS